MQWNRVFASFMVAGFCLNSAVRSDTTAVVGEIIKVDGPTGTITVKHGPISDLGLTAQSAVDAFRVNGDVMQGMVFNALRPGDHIRFRADRINGQLIITEAAKN